MRYPTRIGELLHTVGELLSLVSHCPSVSHTCWKILYLQCSRHYWKSGEDWGPDLVILSVVQASHLAVLPSPASMYGIYNQVKFLKLPTLLSSREVELILFSLVWAFGYHLCSIYCPGGYYSTKEALTKFTQQVLNDSQQSLSLLNTEISLMRKTVFQNTMALDMITALQGCTCAII